MAMADRATEQALDWMLVQRSGRMTATQQEAFAQWLASDSRHADVWQRLQARLAQPLAGLKALEQRAPGQLDEARRLLLVPRRRRAVQLGLVLGAGALAAALLERQVPLAGLLADFSTGTGERRRFTLDDGSAITLNARSAADRLGDGARGCVLRSGEALVEAVAGALPFALRTAHGSVRTAQARFVVRTDGAASDITVLQQSVQCLAADGSLRLLAAGESLRLTATGPQPLPAGEAPDADWLGGWLVAEDLPLARVVERLQPYRAGVLQVAASAASLRVQGSFPLDDTERALRALEETLPLQVRRFGPLLTRIERRA